jgi:SAM-dependent methyltransferase
VTDQSDPTEQHYRNRRRAHWDKVAADPVPHSIGGAYHRRLATVYAAQIAPGQRVLEVGCGNGDLLAATRPRRGLGIDFSHDGILRARTRHSDLQFIEADAQALPLLSETFDVIILSDLINDLWDVELVFRQLATVSRTDTRLILNFYSRVWELPLHVGQTFGFATPVLPQNWLTVQDVDNLLRLSNWEPTRQWLEILLPLDLPLLRTLANRYLVKIWPLNQLALVHFMMARPRPTGEQNSEPVVSVIIPARNEAGNIRDIFERTPPMGSATELIFVEGHSTDSTYAVIEREIVAHPERHVRLLKQNGRGKGDAVRLGFSEASGDVLMILDADLTVPPETLPRFLEALVSGNGEFINGVRLVYPMERQAMRFFNLLGNKFFSLAFSWLLGQPVKDSLCGTKVLRRIDYERIASNRSYFGDFDPFGDFDLLFGAARLNLKIVDLPIRYRERKYGETNIQRWKHGFLLLRMVLFAARRIKFI